MAGCSTRTPVPSARSNAGAAGVDDAATGAVAEASAEAAPSVVVPASARGTDATPATGAMITCWSDRIRSAPCPTPSVMTRGASDGGRLRKATKAPSPPTKASPATTPSSRMSTVRPGAARPATSASPSGARRTVSNCGRIVPASFAAVGAPAPCSAGVAAAVSAAEVWGAAASGVAVSVAAVSGVVVAVSGAGVSVVSIGAA